MAFNFDKKLKEFKRVQRILPRQIGNIAKTHYLKAFRDQGFTDKNLNPWEKRKTRNKSDRRNKKRRAILVDTGTLRRSIRVGRASWNGIEVGSFGVKYAKYHNQLHRKYKNTRRQFIGDSQVMRKQIRAKIDSEIIKILKAK